MTKNELRTYYKTLRKQLSQETIREKSLVIANQSLALPIWDKNYFHIFLPIVFQHEVDTEFMLHILQGKDKNVLISKSDFKTRQMTHFLLTDNTKIKVNGYGIPEPVEGIEISQEKIEVVFVPLLAFDHAGNRIGYGKGFYDRFLAGCKPSTVKVGLSFFEAAEPWEDVFESDVKLDYCVTSKTIYRF